MLPNPRGSYHTTALAYHPVFNRAWGQPAAPSRRINILERIALLGKPASAGILTRSVMEGKTTRDQRHHLFERRCVSCGHNGPDLQIDDAILCPVCGCDLLERPPRSYAEMEGLTVDAPRSGSDRRRTGELWTHPTVPMARNSSRALERWLLFLFFSLLMLFAIAALATAALQA